MKRIKPWSALLLAAALIVSLLTGCSQEQAAGISLSVCVGSEPVTLDPIYAEETADQTILVHLYENLMRVALDATGQNTVTYGIAKSVSQEANYDGTVTYTFKLRSAHWSDGVSVKADDFVYAWQRLADPASQSPYAELLSVVVGYDEARASGDMSLLQVTAKNDTTLEVVLNGNYDWFLSQVCTSPATMPLRQDVIQSLKEDAMAARDSGEDEDASWWSDPTKLVTNGAFTATSATADQMVLSSNADYHGTRSGPDELVFRYADTPEEASALYEAEEVSAVWTLTEEQLTQAAENPEWTGIPELSTYTVLFNCNRLQDVQIRNALSLTIDRTALAQVAGATASPAEGLVPPGVPEDEETDFRSATQPPLLDNSAEAYEEQCQEAKALMAQAGYDSGANLGQLEYLYVDEGVHAAVAEALCQMWHETLGLEITPRGVTEQELWTALRSGDYTIAATRVGAAGNDAECFLMQWTTSSPDNVVGYSNSAYDTLMSIIASATDGTARMGCLHDAEELLLTDSALSPLYYRRTDWQLRENLTGACRDARGWFVFANVVPRT